MDMTDQQALETIERICGDDFCEDLEMRSATKALEASPDLKTAAGKLAVIYRIAHSLVKSHPCFRVHDDWRREAERLGVELCEQVNGQTN